MVACELHESFIIMRPAYDLSRSIQISRLSVVINYPHTRQPHTNNPTVKTEFNLLSSPCAGTHYNITIAAVLFATSPTSQFSLDFYETMHRCSRPGN